MRKVLLATTALATVAGFTAVATADVSVSGAVEWRYISYSDDETATGSNRKSDNRFDSLTDITISLSETTDTGLTMSANQNWNDGSGTSTFTSISGDFGTIEVAEGTTAICAAASYDVTSVGHAGGHGDFSGDFYDGTGSSSDGKVTTVGMNEAAIRCTSSTHTINYHSPSYGGFSFGIGTGNLALTDDNSTTSYGAMYSGSMGDVSYSIGIAGYDGVGSSEDGTHTGATVSMGNITAGIGRSVNTVNASSKKETLSYSVTYGVNDSLSLNVGRVDAKNKLAAATTDDAELTNTTVGVKYTIAPGLYFTFNNHSFDYKVAGASKNSGSAIQSEVKMSF
jgi:hypothetical protein